MNTAKSNTEKPIFFIHTITPFHWVLLMVFVRPFYNIRCYQYHHVKEIGFKRLRIDTLSHRETIELQKKATDYARERHFLKACQAHLKVTGPTLDLSNYFAKNMTRFVADLSLSAGILAKTESAGGVFIFGYTFADKELKRALTGDFHSWCGLRHHPFFETVIGGLVKTICLMGNFGMLLLSFFGFVIKKDWRANIALDNKVFYSASAITDLNPNMKDHLSAGFFIDDHFIRKEDIIFISGKSHEAKAFKEAGFQVCRMFDLADMRDFLKLFFVLVSTIFRYPRTMIRVLNCFSPPWLFHYLLLMEILLDRASIRGFVYTNSDANLEPLQTVSFRARGLPAVLFYYSASIFVSPMWAYLQASHIFVWNESMIQFIESHPQSNEKNYRVSGPLMQVEDDIDESTLIQFKKDYKLYEESPQMYNIGIFDRPAFYRDYLENIRIVLNPMLTEESHSQFLFDIFSVLELNENIRFLLKPKRWFGHHDINQEAIDFIEKEKDHVKLLDASVNPQLAIQSCDLVICLPYTSIFFAALQKNIPAFFYYPYDDGTLTKDPLLEEFNVYGKENLHKKVSEHFGKSFEEIFDSSRVSQLCGLEPRKPVRREFINQLSSILN